MRRIVLFLILIHDIFSEFWTVSFLFEVCENFFVLLPISFALSRLIKNNDISVKEGLKKNAHAMNDFIRLFVF